MADAHASPPPLGPPRNLPSPYEYEILKAFEKKEAELWKYDLKLQKQANKAMIALGNSSVVILLVLLGCISLIVVSQAQRGQFSCRTALGWTIVTLFSFGGCYGLSLVSAVAKIRQLSHPSTDLVNRQRLHILSIEAFKDDLRGRGLLKSQSVFGRRLGALGALTASKDFSVYYREILVWSCVAVLVALTIYMMAGVIFCNGDGRIVEMRYTY